VFGVLNTVIKLGYLAVNPSCFKEKAKKYNQLVGTLAFSIFPKTLVLITDEILKKSMTHEEQKVDFLYLR